MPYAVSEGGVRIHYVVEGGDGPPLLLHHGFTQCKEDWYESGYVDYLKPSFKLVLMDARGFGESDKPHDEEAYSPERWTTDVACVLDAIGVSRAHFWGYSLGGWIGFCMAVYRPERIDRLVLGGSHPFGLRKEMIRHYLRGLVGQDLHEFCATLERNSKFPATPERNERLLRTDIAAWAALYHDQPDFTDLLPNVRRPCCIYAGTGDNAYARACVASRLMPMAKFVSLPGLSHPGGFLISDVVLPRISPFLSEPSEHVPEAQKVLV